MSGGSATMLGANPLENFIAGGFRSARIDRGLLHVNPSDPDDVIARVPEGSVEDVSAAVHAAAEAFPAWRRLPGASRGEYLHRWAAEIENVREDLARAMSREVGKPISEARGEVARCVVILRYYAGDAVRERGEVIPAQMPGGLQFTLRDALGVVGLITPWNFPLAIPLWKAAPALAFGNTVVLKPSEQSSVLASMLAATAAAAELPPGAFNVVLGGGAAGAALLECEPVRAVSFTGSTAVGTRVAAACARRNIRYQTEMGGKNVVIVLPDADLRHAARLTAAGAMRYAGQKCTATSRAVVVESVEEDFIRLLREEIEALPLGPVDDAAAAVGPLINAAARDRVQSIVETAAGSRIFGGVPSRDARFGRGFFIEPALLRDVDPDSAVAQDEIFGPVLATIVASDLDEALELANRTRYGLSASLFTRDLGAALTYIDRIEAGLVRVNGDTTGVDPHAPFGGVKASSSGTREQGSAARDFYTEVRTVQVQTP